MQMQFVHRDGRRKYVGRKTARRGITLLEVLVSIFILTVGLLGVAALIPLGNLAVTRGNVAYRGAEVARRTFREVRLRGWTRPEMWLTSEGKSIIDKDTQEIQEIYRNKPLAFDPLTAAVAPGMSKFPPGDGASMSLLTFRNNPEVESPMNYDLARSICVPSDELSIERPDEKSKHAIQRLSRSESRRETIGNYSWMMTLVPDPYDRISYVASIVVFYQNRPAVSGGDSSIRETRTITDVRQLGGSEYSLGVNSKMIQDKFAVPGRWLMLSDGELFRWYRILAVEGQTGDSASSRVFSLAGAEWPEGTALSATLFKGVVAVHEKRILLEQPSDWLPFKLREAQGKQWSF
jgi:type II secretory pathway pseudopilin PulG